MKKETEAMCWVVFWLLLAILNYLIYFEVFGNVNKYGYLWLLKTIFCFCMFVINGVKLEILRSK